MSKEVGKMVRSRDVVQAEGEGARRATGVPAGGAAAGAGSLAPGQRWSAGRKRARNTSYAMPRSANVCPRNRVRYTSRFSFMSVAW